MDWQLPDIGKTLTKNILPSIFVGGNIHRRRPGVINKYAHSAWSDIKLGRLHRLTITTSSLHCYRRVAKKTKHYNLKMINSSKKMSFLKILQVKAGDKSILTRAKTNRRDLDRTAPVSRGPRALVGGPVGSGVVCSACLQPATMGACRGHRGTECGPWISDKQTAVRNLKQSDACYKHTNSSPHLCKSQVISSDISLLTGNSTPVSTSSCDSDVFFPDDNCCEQNLSTYWIGCKFIYSLKSETIKINIIQNGQLQYPYSPTQKLYANITLVRGEKSIRKTVSLGTVGHPNTRDKKVKFSEHSCFRTQHMGLEVEVFVENGLFRAGKLVDSWTIPLTECHFLYSRTKWHYLE